AGFVVLQIPNEDDRGDPDDEINPYVDAYQSAIATLDARKIIDRNAVGIIGFSITGMHVMSALVQKPQLFTAAAITEGNDASYVQYLISSADMRDLYEEIYGGPPVGAGLANWVARAPNFNIERIQAPLLLGVNSKDELLSEWETYTLLKT